VKSKDFNCIVRTMKALVKFQGHGRKHNTIFISNIIRDGDRKFAYAYWKEDKSITILRLPLSLPLIKNSPEHWWLMSKARIDLVHGVVPTEEDIHGSSFLVDKHWVRKILRKCKRGIRLRL